VYGNGIAFTVTPLSPEIVNGVTSKEPAKLIKGTLSKIDTLL
jgi:hypothetical protein